jgi:hypothetical protein
MTKLVPANGSEVNGGKKRNAKKQALNEHDDNSEMEERRPIRIEDIPEDPLSMPPPYWRSSGAIFHVLSGLQSMIEQLALLPSLIAKTDRKLDRHYDKYPTDSESKKEIALQEFGEICDDLWELEHAIKLDSERAILMSAIAAEDDMNKFCVFNLHRDIAETIEKLSLSEKLLVASGALGKHAVKGEAVYEKTKKLTSWRNAFAHGHCVDRPVKSLRHNHLIHPDEYPGVPSAVATAIDLVAGFLILSRYLQSISLNGATGCDNTDNLEVEERLSILGRYSFEGDQIIYPINRKSKRKKAARAKKNQD